MNLPADEKRRLLSRLRRAEGQVAAVRRMIEEDSYCVDVLTQVAAARGALVRVGDSVLRNHVETCLASALRSEDEEARVDKIDELMDVLVRYRRA